MTWQEHALKHTVQTNTHNSSRSFGQFGQKVECVFTNKVVLRSSLVGVSETSDRASFLRKEFVEIQANIERGLTVKRECDMTRT